MSEAADGKVTGEPPAARHQRRDDHEAQRPECADRVEEAEERLELAGEAVEVVKRFCSNAPGSSWCQMANDQDADRR